MSEIPTYFEERASEARKRGDEWSEIYWLARGEGDDAYNAAHDRLKIERGLIDQPRKETKR